MRTNLREARVTSPAKNNPAEMHNGIQDRDLCKSRTYGMLDFDTGNFVASAFVDERRLGEHFDLSSGATTHMAIVPS